MATNTFQIYMNNTIKCAPDGSGSVTFTPNSFAIPSGTIYGGPATLAELINMVGAMNILINYYISATGSHSKNDCWALHTLNGVATLSDGTNSGNVMLAYTNYDTGAAAPVNSGWLALMINTTSLISTLTTNGQCSYSGCGCGFEYYGGWSGVSISLRLDVFVNLYNYCTAGPVNNIYQDMCYKYIGDNINDANLGTSEQITSGMKNYCATKYPSGNLSLFNDPSKMDPKDYDLCACNMPDDYYKQLKDSLKTKFPDMNLGPVEPNCLLPACLGSKFKNNELNNCQVPMCFSQLTVNGDNTVNQAVLNANADCSGYGISTGGGPGPIPTPGPTPRPSFWQEYKWWIVAGIALLVLLVILFIILGVDKSREYNKYSQTATITTTKIPIIRTV